MPMADESIWSQGTMALISELNCPMQTDLLLPTRLTNAARWLTVAMAMAVLAACESPPSPKPVDPALTLPPQPPIATTVPPKSSTDPVTPTDNTSTSVPPPTASTTPPVSGPQTSPELETMGDVLRYTERLRAMSNAELNAELSRAGEPGIAPVQQLRTALILMNTRAPADTARSLGLLQRVASSADESVVALRPLVKLLTARLTDQRRVEEALDRQTQAVREAQRRIEALNSRLEAMRAIERSLSPSALPPNAPAGPRPPGM